MNPRFGAFKRLGAFARARAGVAAVEFAFILPLMLVLYFGLAVLGQGLEVGRKVQLASRTLADLASQQLPSAATGVTGSGNCASVTTTPCVADADLNDFYAGAQLVLTPFAATTLSATLSEVIFYNATATTTSGCCKARVMWSVGFGASPTLRACGVAGLTAVANGINGAGVMPVGNYPGGAQGAAVAAGAANSTAYYVIVADVTYQFKPGYDFKLFNWGSDAHGGAGYTISQTTYMIPRYSATKPIKWTPGGVISSANYRSCVSGVDYYAP
ncbi:Flp pilus assembly protein TadG [Rhodoblastus acidophilus]|uniref:TadE/TadG family type IV pilus assembly protein n=1 Tax=Rhodoblastus acidophilus TaxID=1074 RepID=UPI00222534D0|nr:TadE/TadG family type IV pilus assembly protein [Rhodoblastus acidophilus]MCW2314654.1 Flp pilus assembly protein TadG [Rhodoblastus acidophilus]